MPPGRLEMVMPPMLDNKHTSLPSVLVPSALLREAGRQKNTRAMGGPSVCLLDPDGDFVRALHSSGNAKPFAGRMPDSFTPPIPAMANFRMARRPGTR